MTTPFRLARQIMRPLSLLVFVSAVSARAETAAFTLGKINYVRVVPELDYVHVRHTDQPLSIPSLAEAGEGAVTPPSSFGLLRDQSAAICRRGVELEFAEAGFAQQLLILNGGIALPLG